MKPLLTVLLLGGMLGCKKEDSTVKPINAEHATTPVSKEPGQIEQFRVKAKARKLQWQIFPRGGEYVGYATPGDIALNDGVNYWLVSGGSAETVARALAVAIDGKPNMFTLPKYSSRD